MAEPVTVQDAAEYILRLLGEVSTWKLQKLCYYAQAWSLVWDREPLFKEDIEAWANGPVVPALYKHHRGQFRVSATPNGEPDNLNHDQRETIDAVLRDYGGFSAAALSGLSHRETPWSKTRSTARLRPGERGRAVISHELMADYYGGIYER